MKILATAITIYKVYGNAKRLRQFEILANGIKAKVFSKVYSGKNNESTDDISGTGNKVLFLEAGPEHIGGFELRALL